MAIFRAMQSWPGGLVMGAVLGLAVLTGGRAGPAPLAGGTDPASGLPYWAYQGDGISARLVQRLPDQTRAFFMARGFDRDAAEVIALGCVFQTIVRNIGSGPEAQAIEYDVAQWRVHVAGRTRAVKLKSQWDREWTVRGLPETARIAFRWSLLPTRQRLEPSDYNWGMSTFDLPPGQRFDLELVWSRGEQQYRGAIEGMRCAPDGPAANREQEEE